MAFVAPLFTGALGTFFGTAVGGALLQIGGGILLNELSQALFGEPEIPAAKDPGQRVKFANGAGTPRGFMLGRGEAHASFDYANDWEFANGVESGFLVRVYTLSDMPVSGLVEMWVDGKKRTFGASNARGMSVTEYNKNGKDNMWVRFYDGTQTTESAYLVEKFGSLAGRSFGPDCINTGSAYAIVTCRYNPKVFKNGLPKPKFILEGMPLYDISKDSTEGGSGTHRWDDESTWGGDGDDNPMVQAYNLLRGIRYNGEWVLGAQTIQGAQLPAADWIAAIERCREQVNIPNSATEDRYRCGGTVYPEAGAEAILASRLKAASAHLSKSGGLIRPHVGWTATPVVHIDYSDTLYSQPINITPFAGMEEAVNVVEAQYTLAKRGWESEAVKTVRSASGQVEDGGRILPITISFPEVWSGYQAQRLAREAMKEARRDVVIQQHLPRRFYGLEAGDVVTYTDAPRGYVDKKFRVEQIEVSHDLTLAVALKEIVPGDYDAPDVGDYEIEPDALVDDVETNPVPVVTGVTLSTAVVNGAQSLVAAVEWDGTEIDNISSVRVEIAEAGGQVVYSGVSDAPISGEHQAASGIAVGVDYEARIWYILPNGLNTDPSAAFAFTTTGALPAIDPTDIDIQLLSDGLDAAGQYRFTVTSTVTGEILLAPQIECELRENSVSPGSWGSAQINNTGVFVFEDLPNNSYQTRVRGIDALGQPGPWVETSSWAGPVLFTPNPNRRVSLPNVDVSGDIVIEGSNLPIAQATLRANINTGQITEILLEGTNSNGDHVTYGAIRAFVLDDTAGQEDGRISLLASNNGTLEAGLEINTNVPNNPVRLRVGDELKRVYRGNTDSAGSGYRALRVEN